MGPTYFENNLIDNVFFKQGIIIFYIYINFHLRLVKHLFNIILNYLKRFGVSISN